MKLAFALIVLLVVLLFAGTTKGQFNQPPEDHNFPWRVRIFYLEQTRVQVMYNLVGWKTRDLCEKDKAEKILSIQANHNYFSTYRVVGINCQQDGRWT